MEIKEIYEQVISEIKPMGGADINTIPLTSDLGQAVIAKIAKQVSEYHIEKALDVVCNNAKLSWDGRAINHTYTISADNTYYDNIVIGIDKDSIYQSYPLDNIK